MAALTDNRKERYAQARAASGSPGNLGPNEAIKHALPYVTSTTKLRRMKANYQLDSTISDRITEIG